MGIDDSEITRFLEDPAFVRLVKEEFGGARWKAYESAHSDRREALAQAVLVVLAEDQFPKQQLDDTNQRELWEKIDVEISENVGAEERRSMWWKRLAAAAVFIAMLGVGVWVQRSQSNNGQTVVSLPVMSTATNNKEIAFAVDLPDGSVVLLAPGSTIQYSGSDFESNGAREIFLSGEAFFEVVSNEKSPFFVFTDGLTTRVLGTSFNVKAPKGAKQVEVLVKTGLVSVFSSGADDTDEQQSADVKIVKPNERAVMDLVSKTLTLDKIDEADYQIRSSIENFDDQPVSEIFKTLEDNYDIKINYPEEVLRECRITASFSNETLYEKMSLICRGLGASYAVEDGEIVIQSKGCR